MNGLFVINESFHKRYYRQGSIVHHGDCDFFSISLCTCGLLHDLLWYMVKYPKDMEKIYPKIFDELAVHNHKKYALLVSKRNLTFDL